MYLERLKEDLKDDSLTTFAALSNARAPGVGDGSRGTGVDLSSFLEVFDDDSSGNLAGCSCSRAGTGADCIAGCGMGWVAGTAFGAILELVTTGLGADMLAVLLDLLLSFCTFLVAQLAVEGSAEPSPLSLLLIVSSRLPCRPIECDAAETACGAC